MNMKKSGFAVVAGALCLLVVNAIPAIAQPPGGQPYGQQQQRMEVDKEDLDKAARAYVEINKIRQEFEQEVQQTGDTQERQRLQQDAQTEMARAVENEGLDIATYNAIINAIQTDEALRQQFMNKVNKVQGGQ